MARRSNPLFFSLYNTIHRFSSGGERFGCPSALALLGVRPAVADWYRFKTDVAH